MKVIKTSLPGVLVIEPKVFGDSRGFFTETYHYERYAEAGIKQSFVQDNHSRSSKGVLRGLHYQLEHPQGKLVQVMRGEVLDVAVDIRVGSPTFGQYYSHILNDQNHQQLYVPPGFAHGFCVVSDVVDFVYKCTDYYHPESEKGIAWNDPNIGIDWPGGGDKSTDYNISEKDQNNPLLVDIPEKDLPVYKVEP